MGGRGPRDVPYFSCFDVCWAGVSLRYMFQDGAGRGSTRAAQCCVNLLILPKTHFVSEERRLPACLIVFAAPLKGCAASQSDGDMPHAGCGPHADAGAPPFPSRATFPSPVGLTAVYHV